MTDLKKLPDVVNGVLVSYAKDVDRMVHINLFDAFNLWLDRFIVNGRVLNSVYISCASDEIDHEWPSRHAQKKALDLSRINDKYMSLTINQKDKADDPEVVSITSALQEKWETIPMRRENAGPYLMLKSGKPKRYSPHDDHIHISVD